MPHEIRDSVVDYVNYWTKRTETSNKQLLGWIGLDESTFYKWVQSYGADYKHNGAIPRDHWLEDWEEDAIIAFHFDHPLNGYRRLTYMMLDADIVAVSAATVYRERLHSATGYITPADMLAGRDKEIHAERDRKLEEARSRRSDARHAAKP